MKIKFSTIYNRTKKGDVFVEGIIETPTQTIKSKTYLEHQQRAYALIEGKRLDEFNSYRVVKSKLGQDIVYA